MVDPAAARVRTVFLNGLAFFDQAVQHVLVTDWPRPSPCAGWRALDVLGHAGAVARFCADLARDGRPVWAPPERPGDDVGADPAAWWTATMTRTISAIEVCDLSRPVRSSTASQTIAAAISFPAVDLYVHAWDVMRSVGGAVDIPADVVAFAHQAIDPMPAAVVRNAQAFGPAVPAPPMATESDAFIAWTGRHIVRRPSRAGRTAERVAP
jgi:uncharacterized protein (TIGR03086 family)